MRTAFRDALLEVARHDPRVWLINGDLGFSVLEPFREEFPERFLNAGVAEQNMTGVAAGLALCGKVVFTYSICNFATLRCLEQIRNDVCYHHADVKVVSVGGGLAYGTQGYTHMGVEDLAVLRTLPGMTVVAPGDPVEAGLATRAVANLPGPCYLRLGKAGEPRVHTEIPDFHIGRAIRVREGSDLTLISTGGMLKAVVEAAELLTTRGVTARVLSMHTLKPLDVNAVLQAASETGCVLTVEEHLATGGLGGAVAEVLLDHGQAPRFRRLALPETVAALTGKQSDLLRVYGLDAEGIAGSALEVAALTRGPGEK